MTGGGEPAAVPVAWRGVQHGRVRWVLPAWQLEQTDRYVVLHVPVGASGWSRDGLRDGPRNGFLRQVNFLDTFSPTAWKLLDLVAVHRFGDGWSTWRWRTEENSWQPGAYLNLELPWERSAIGWDSEDLTLDVVVGDGTIRYKDEDELAWAVEVGAYSAAEAERIRGYGRDAFAAAERRRWPLDADWDRWIPREPGLPPLAEGWDQVS